MKKTISLFLFLILQSHFIFADKPTVKGYYITKDKDSIPVTFTINTKLLSKEMSDEGMQGHIKYITKKGVEGKIKPEDTFEYGFTYEGKKYKYASIPLSWQPFKSEVFMRVEVDGYCKLLIYYQRGSDNRLYDYYVLRKGQENGYMLSVVSGMAMKQSLTEYFSDCEAVKPQIKSKDYEGVANQYNKQCAAK